MTYYRISGDCMINLLVLTAAAYEESAGSEVNPLNALLAVAYILIAMALIYVILLCIDKFARKRQDTEAEPEKKADDEKDEGNDG